MADDPPGRAGPSVLVAGVGNIFLGDDGFGSEVARRLEGQLVPDGVRITDYGIGGIHLAYDLLDDVDLLVLIDAVEHGAEPGTVSVIEADTDSLGDAQMDSHAMDPAAVLSNLRRLGGTPPRTLIVACEPADSTERLGLTDLVAAAVDPAVEVVLDLVRGDRPPVATLDGATAPAAVPAGISSTDSTDSTEKQ